MQNCLLIHISVVKSRLVVVRFNIDNGLPCFIGFHLRLVEVRAICITNTSNLYIQKANNRVRICISPKGFICKLCQVYIKNPQTSFAFHYGQNRRDAACEEFILLQHFFYMSLHFRPQDSRIIQENFTCKNILDSFASIPLKKCKALKG